MRIEYRILWIEDDRNWFEESENLLKGTLEEYGFKLKCKRIANIDEFNNNINENDLRDFDLLLIDLMLGEGENKNGDMIIKSIREKEIYTDIIFYSSDLSGVHEIMKAHKLEGVYSSNREDLESKFEKVFNTIIKKIQEVNTIRGLVMAETSDLDALMLEIIKKELKTSIVEDIEKYSLDLMLHTLDQNQKNIADSSTKFEAKVENSKIFTTFHKARAVNKICQLDYRLEDRKFFENYNNDVMKTRNTLAHVTEIVLDGKRVLVSNLDRNKVIIDEEECIKIRKNLIKYSEILENYREIVSQ